MEKLIIKGAFVDCIDMLQHRRKYLSQVQEISGVLNSTLSKHFNKHKQPYETNHFLIFKCDNVDTKGNYKNNFIN